MLNSRSLPLFGLVLAAIYVPTLATPFDFIDDGNLVYPAPAGTTMSQHVERWWDRVVANYEHLGPVRPVLWAHWEVFANTTNGVPLGWRSIRLVWCGFAAMMFLTLMRELRIHPYAALIVGAVAFWNPFRNEIWTSLTLGEGVAMPYAMLALVAAKRAANGSRWWDVLALGGIIAALGCKNTFIALLPAMMLLRLVRDDGDWRRNRWATLLYLLPLVLPIAHFIYFKLNWKPGQYETHSPSLDQFLRVLNALKGALSLDYLGVGIAMVLSCIWQSADLHSQPKASTCCGPMLKTSIVGVLVLTCGIVVYLPMTMMSGRYTMPAVWGADILIAILLTRFAGMQPSWRTRVAWGALVVGVIVLGVVNVARQEKFAARAKLLWDVVHHLETQAPQNAIVEWIAGDSSRGELNVEEGIHVRWHLIHRGRGDIHILLLDPQLQRITRVELPQVEGRAICRISGPARESAVQVAKPLVFERAFWFGRKRTTCTILGDS